MSDLIAHTPLQGPTTYDFGQATPTEWPQGEYVPKAVYDALAADVNLWRHRQQGTANQLAIALSHARDIAAELASYKRLTGEMETADIALRARVKALEVLCLDARYFVKHFTCTHQEHEVLRSHWLKQFPEEPPIAQSKSQQKRFEAQGVAHVPFAGETVVKLRCKVCSNDHYPTCDAGPCINCGWPAADCIRGKCCKNCHHSESDRASKP